MGRLRLLHGALKSGRRAFKKPKKPKKPKGLGARRGQARTRTYDKTKEPTRAYSRPPNTTKAVITRQHGEAYSERAAMVVLRARGKTAASEHRRVMNHIRRIDPEGRANVNIRPHHKETKLRRRRR